ncbi:MAG: GntR family transcriptional regulator [Pseudomonadota bacterium]
MQDAERRPLPSVGHVIAEEIRQMILDGDLGADDRLPGEQELANRFGVSRPSIREALKRLAAQNLIRTRRGAAGGNFVNRMGMAQAQEQLEANATMLIVLGGIDPDVLAEARLTLLTACAPLAAERRDAATLNAMRAEVQAQRGDLSDESFCASDVRFYRALVDAAKNPMLSLQMAGVIEAIQPLLNMIIYRARDRHEIARRHERLLARLEARDAEGMIAELSALSEDTARLVRAAQMARAAKRGG